MLISITADIGIIGYVDARVPKPAYINQHIALVRLNPEKASGRFISYFLASEESQRVFRSTTDTGAKAGMSLGSVQKILAAFPPTTDEQRAIAAALSDTDALLDGLDRLVAKKRAIKQAAMQQLLTGKTRLPGFSGKWEVRRIGDILSIKHGKSQKAVEASDGSYPILATGGKIGTASQFLYDKPSVLIGRKGTINQPQYMDRPFWSVDTLFYSEMKRENVAKFFYYGFCLIDWMQYNEASGVPSLNAKTIESIEFTCPEPEEQAAIAPLLSDMDAEITALETRRAKTRALKQAMMQELLTGRTRLLPPVAKPVANIVDFPVAKTKAKSHNWQINEAVVISVLVSRFGTEQYPMGRKRCTKLAYLMHRHVEHVAEGFRKKAAGPYNPDVKYRGPEGIAQKNGYIRQHRNGSFAGFVAAGNIGKADAYFMEWYGQEVLEWLEQFRYKKNDDLELLATVDMAAEELKQKGSFVALESVKALIAAHPEWKAKLSREIFSDSNILRAIRDVSALFTEQG